MAMRVRWRWLAVGLVLVVVGGAAWQFGLWVWAYVGGGGAGPAGAAGPLAADRPWAEPVRLDGAANLYRVSDTLYRGAQPTAEGMKGLVDMGIRTVVNLRSLHSDREEIGSLPLGRVEISIKPFDPGPEELLAFLRVATDPNRRPVFVHCQRGIDRTGMVCAVYRMVVQGWTREEAIGEMTRGPFGYDEVFRNIPAMLWRLDVEALKARLAEPGPVER